MVLRREDPLSKGVRIKRTMSKILWKSLLISPAVLGATLAVCAGTKPALSATAENLATPETAQAQTVEAQPVAIAASPVTPVDNTTVEFSNPVPEVPQIAQVPPTAQSNPDAVLQQLNRYSNEGSVNAQDQVTNVSQLRDVSPGDWAYEALRSLVERYGCIVGYPDGTFRGNRATSRYEFAAGLNACLQQIERLIAASTADFATKEDLETLRRLVEEFRAELTALGTRVDALEGRVSFLEDNQFSTTTKLSGEAIFALTDTFTTSDDDDDNDGIDIGINDNDNTNTVFGDRIRLSLNTSFTGNDVLLTRLAAGNLDAFNVANGRSGEGAQTFNFLAAGRSANNNDIVLDKLTYTFRLGNSQAYVAAAGGEFHDFVPTTSPTESFQDFDGGNGALSTFAQENPIYRIGGGAGAGISFGFSPIRSILGPSTITLGYLAGNANNPGEDNGVFNGDYGALAQINFNLFDRVAVGATYVHGYHTNGDIFAQGDTNVPGVVGTRFANNPGRVIAGNNVPLVTNSDGLEAAFRPFKGVSLSGFATLTDVTLLGRGNAEVWTYGAGLAFPDLGRTGSVLGLFAGVQPTLRGIEAAGDNDNFSRDNSYHFEGFYKYQLTDNISVTPGVIWLTSPGQNSNNDDAIIGTLRTTFTF